METFSQRLVAGQNIPSFALLGNFPAVCESHMEALYHFVFTLIIYTDYSVPVLSPRPDDK